MPAPILILATRDIRRQLQINLVSPQTAIMIVTPFLQDVELGTSRSLRVFLSSQVSAGTTVELFTTPPNLNSAGEFRRKYRLLESFSAIGVRILLNGKLHAKAFCFNRDGSVMVTLLGSANLTTAALQDRLELAMFSARDSVYHSAMAHIRIFERDGQTEEYLAWKRRRYLQINALLKGVAP